MNFIQAFETAVVCNRSAVFSFSGALPPLAVRMEISAGGSAHLSKVFYKFYARQLFYCIS